MTRRPRNPCRGSLLVGVLLTLGCSASEPNYCEDPCRWTALVNVHVIDTANRPVPQATFQLHMFLQPCGPSQDPRAVDNGITDAEGHRKLLVTALRGPETMRCVVLTVNPLGDPAYPGGSKVFPAALEFRAEDGSPRDSMRLDIIVP